MLEQIDHHGKRFTIDGNDVVNEKIVRCRRTEALEQQVQRECRELERSKAVADPTGTDPDVEVLDR
ncbi:hypothetical protein FEJ81_20870 (plasmid) [Natrinema versiforme]|uniref:Uncharacterized protein n=1 Tax=Natrinema versiforme TaxID=88724 RepID=A0A4P8WNF7_9EURY|nr:hypothetical protein [Natrinema versiforme]QCS44732.1 hypothetical protein FEJ81_20870 [Natrinema versiforme]